MKKYLNKNGNSGIYAYEFEPHGIRIQFNNGSIYFYTEDSAGPQNIKTMKRLAEKGLGLSTFISQCVRDNYAHKEK